MDAPIVETLGLVIGLKRHIVIVFYCKVEESWWSRLVPARLHLTSISLAKGFAHGLLSLHPRQSELEFRIHALSISNGCSYY